MANEGRILKRNYPGTYLGGAGNGCPVKNAAGQIIRRRAPAELAMGQTGTLPSRAAFSNAIGWAPPLGGTSSIVFVWDEADEDGGRIWTAPLFDVQYSCEWGGGVRTGPAARPYLLGIGNQAKWSSGGLSLPYWEQIEETADPDRPTRTLVTRADFSLNMSHYELWAPGWGEGHGGAFSGASYAALAANVYETGRWTLYAAGRCSCECIDERDGSRLSAAQSFQFRAAWRTGKQHRMNAWLELAFAGMETFDEAVSGTNASGGDATTSDIDGRGFARAALAATTFFF